MRLEVAQQPAADRHVEQQEGQQQRRLGRLVPTRADHHEQQDREPDQHQREAAVKAPGLGVRPRVQRPHHSRPLSESVQASWRGQALQTCAFAR